MLECAFQRVKIALKVCRFFGLGSEEVLFNVIVCRRISVSAWQSGLLNIRNGKTSGQS